MEELPEVDAIIGTGDIDKIESVVDDIFRQKNSGKLRKEASTVFL